MTMNPADEAAENYKNEVDKLRAEVRVFRFYFTFLVIAWRETTKPEQNLTHF